METISLKLKKGMWAYFLYAVLLYFLAVFLWPKIDADEFIIYHYTKDFHWAKFIVSIFFSLSLLIIISTYYYTAQKVADKIMVLLSMLYFLPGFAISGVVNFEWSYMIAFFMYYIALVFFDRIISDAKKPLKTFNHKSTQILKISLIALAIIFPFYLVRVFGKSLSLSNIILTLNDPYGIRKAATELNVHWMIIMIEKWGCYFGCVMITYFLRKKKYVLGSIFVIIGFFYFILQGNRIFLFFVGIAIALGFLNIKRNNIKYVFLGIAAALVLEFYLYPTDTLGLVTNVFRRFSLVPNLASTSYFDYFQTAEHDWLRDIFTGIAGFLGVESPHGYNINNIIGERYYGFRMYVNNGLFGGAYYEFGLFGIIIDTTMFVLIMRVIEKVLMRAEENCKWVFAVVFSTLAINEHVIWAYCLKISYILMLLLSFLLFFNSEDEGETKQCLTDDIYNRQMQIN